MPILYYIHDPMCSWCWAFRPTLRHLREKLSDDIEFKRLLGGLAPDTDQPMPQVMQEQLQNTWRRIQQKLPDTRFNFAFWTDNQPRRSTYPACRAVIAAREMDPKLESAMILGIQEAYYLKALNPSDDKVLVHIAEALGLEADQFSSLLNAPETQASLETEIQQSHAMGASRFPSLVLQQGEVSYWPVPVDYLDVGNMLDTLSMILD